MALSQIVYNEKLYSESVLQRQVGKLSAATGIVIGKKETSSSNAATTKYIIYDVILTSNPAETGAGLEDASSS